MSGTRVASDAAELLALVELAEIIPYEVSGRRALAGEREGTEQSLNLMANGAETWVEVRARMVVRTPEADLVAEVGARYVATEPFEADKDAVLDFAERVGVMAVFPFVREAVFSAASRLNVATPVIGLLRAGSFKLDFDEAEGAPADEDGATPSE